MCRKLVITGIDEIHLESDCVARSIANAPRQPILYSFALSNAPGY